MTDDRRLLPAAILALGLTLGGWLAGNGVARARASDRVVTVKGVAEREVQADLAIWPLHVMGADNDLAVANRKLSSSIDGVRQFLARHGIDTSQIQLADFSVSDAEANQYAPDRRPTNRYVVQEVVLVRSDPSRGGAETPPEVALRRPHESTMR